MISYGRQDIDPSDLEAVRETLRSDFLTQGPKVPEFESLLCNTTQARHGVAVNSATSALHLACLALGLTAGDRLWTTPISFVASANCALYCRSKVDFVDIDSATQNMCPVALEAKLKTAATLNALPKIVIPVHFAGQACDMERIHQLSLQYGFKIIEDASHALGGTYKNAPIGSCIYSSITVFSFHAIKMITTGEGGAAMTNDPSLWKRMEILRSHGISKDFNDFQSGNFSPWSYEQIELGFNYRMSELGAALGISQLKRLPEFVKTRRSLAQLYHEQFVSSDIEVPTPERCDQSVWHLYVIRGPKSKRLKIFNQLRDKGIGVNVHYIPIYKQPYYQKAGFRADYCVNAEQYYARCMTLPLHTQLSKFDVDKIANEVINAAR